MTCTITCTFASSGDAAVQQVLENRVSLQTHLVGVTVVTCRFVRLYVDVRCLWCVTRMLDWLEVIDVWLQQLALLSIPFCLLV